MTFLFRKPDPSSRLCHFAATATAAAAAPPINGISTPFRPNPLQSLPQNPPHSAIGRPEKTLPPISPISRSFSSSSDSENPISPPHSGDADKICDVINDLFSSDLNMESVLNNLHIQIESPLVLAVLNRFRHAHRPAHRFFRWASSLPNFSHDSSSYNMMLAILGKTRQFETMVALLEEMGDEGFLSVDAFKISIKAFAAAREMKKCVGIFKLIRKYDFDVELDTFNCLIDALSKAKLAREAKQLLERMKDRYRPDLRTYTALLYGFCKIKDLVEAGMVWNEMLDGGFKPDIVAHNTMLEGLIRGNRKSEGIKLFELMKAKGPVPNTRTYTILIQHFCKGGKMEQAVSCFDDMLAACCLPDVATYTCLIIGFGNAREMSKVSSLLADMSRKGCPPDARTYNALIKLMTNRNMPDDAVRIYKKMIRNGFEPTLHTYNMLMKCYFHGNDYKMGCAVWEEMLAKGICPDVNSFTVFIGGHIRYGSPEEAYKYIEEMINKGMSVPQVDYNKLAADFSRVGRPDVLGELAQKMSFIGKFDASKVLNCWSERMKKRVKRR